MYGKKGFKKGDLSKWTEKALIKFMSLYNTQQHDTEKLHDSKDEIWKIRQAWRDVVSIFWINMDIN